MNPEIEDGKREVTTVSQLIPLVQRLSCRFRRDNWSQPDREDIQQEGYIGLLEAKGRYQSDRGCSFRTFGGRRASGAMLDYVRRLCRRSRERASASMPGDDLGYRNGHGEFQNPKSVESGVMLLRFSQFLGSNALDSLADDEKQVLQLRFFQGKSCRESASIMNVSAATICRLERRALDHIRTRFGDSCGMDLTEAAPREEVDQFNQAEEVSENHKTGLSQIIASLTL